MNSLSLNIIGIFTKNFIAILRDFDIIFGMRKKIVVITGSRAEWGLLKPLCYELKASGADLIVIVTGSHLSENATDILSDEFSDEFVYKQVYITPCFGYNGIESQKNLTEAKLNGNETQMFKEMAQVYEKLPAILRDIKPDIAVVLGDRYEIFAAASVCRLMGIGLAHFSGGELTLGAFDDALRHCITKLSDWHFVSNEEHKKRVIQLGEVPENVYNVGDLAMAGFREMKFKTAEELRAAFGFDFGEFFLLTVHPETCSPGAGVNIVRCLLTDLRVLYPHVTFIFTGSNTDPGGAEINDAIKEAAATDNMIKFIPSMGRLNYLSAAKLSKCVIGNSSSAISEIPALKTPAVNIGNRQKGREHAGSVIDCGVTFSEIKTAVQRALEYSFSDDSDLLPADPAKVSAAIINSFDIRHFTREKAFYDLG